MTHRTILDHTADIGMSIQADTLEEAFAEAAYALRDLLVHVPEFYRFDSNVRSIQNEVAIHGTSLEHLLVKFLSELLFRFETQGLLVTHVEISLITVNDLQCHLEWMDWDDQLMLPKLGIKAITYYQTQVVQKKEGWQIDYYVDI